jgi:hypothetical protein
MRSLSSPRLDLDQRADAAAPISNDQPEFRERPTLPLSDFASFREKFANQYRQTK